jgi:hypothetical protein
MIIDPVSLKTPHRVHSFTRAVPTKTSLFTAPEEGSGIRDAADSFLREAAAVSDPATSDAFPATRLKESDVLADRFVIERLAGRGGMGAVYRALDRLTGLPVALKVIARGGRDDQRFAQEARVLSELTHPAIVRYVAHGTSTQGQPFLAMEWLEGEDLGQRLTASPLTVGESLDVARRLAEGLAVAHERGLLHRDVKPSNVFLVGGRPDRATLLDFGIARMDPSGLAPPMTRTGVVLGTVGYMSPEQAIADRNLDARTDVFALGCVLFECLTGVPAFSGDHLVAVLAKVLREEAPRVRALRPQIPAELDALVARMLSKDRDSRPKDGAVVSRELVGLGSIEGAVPEPVGPAAGGLSGGELRITSVLLALVPDERQLVGEIVERHGGDLAHLANGALLVTLGGKRGSADEQVAIAAACALEISAALPSARIALATGRALTTGAGPSGPIIDQAAALLVRSTSSGIRVDDVTAGLLGTRFEVHSVLVARRRDVDASRTLLGKATPFVGRDKELGLLDATLRECIDDSVARAVLVTGPAGQGKSRLRHELVDRARTRSDVRVLIARADPVGAGSAFMLVRQLVRDAVGVREGEPVSEQHAKLRRYVRDVCNETDAGRIADLLGELIGAPSSEHPSPELRSARNDPAIMAEWLRRSFTEWLTAECLRGPRLLVLEDLHWGDLPSVMYVGEALRASATRPLMVLALARPEVHELFPGLWKGIGVPELPLGGLTPRAAERLARAALGDEFPADTVAHIVEHADGNAFYLEELTRRVAESGGGVALPGTVLALLQSRLEKLEPDARRVVRAASVFGEVFWPGAVATLLGAAFAPHDVEAWFRALVEREVFSATRGSRFPGEREFAFRHGLLREASYAMLTEADRTKGHALAAEWLLAANEKDALILADHFERGGERSRAVTWLVLASEAAAEGWNDAAATSLGHRALACGATGTDRARVLLAQAQGPIFRGEWAAVVELAKEALDRLPVGHSRWCQAAGTVCIAGNFLGDPGITGSMLQVILGVSVQPEPTGPYGIAAFCVCTGLCIMGQLDLARSFLERVEAAGESTSEPDPAFVSWLRLTHGWVDVLSGRIARGLTALLQARTLAERAGDRIGRDNGCMLCAYAFCLFGDLERAEQVAREVNPQSTWYVDMSAIYVAFAKASSHGAHRAREAIATLTPMLDRRLPMLVAAARFGLARALAAIGDFDGAQREATALLNQGFVLPTYQAGALGALAAAALHRGQPADALAFADRGLEAAMAGLRSPGVESTLHLVRGEALQGLGRIQDAQAAIRDARDRILTLAATIEDADLRESYLTNVDANARTLKLAREWLGDDPATG